MVISVSCRQFKKILIEQVAHELLFSAWQACAECGVQPTEDLQAALLLLHSYILIKPLVRAGNHEVCHLCKWGALSTSQARLIHTFRFGISFAVAIVQMLHTWQMLCQYTIHDLF